MNAVNLIPPDLRSRRFSVPTNPATLGLFGGLVLALIGAVLYMSALNSVGARKSELARVTAAAAAWNAAAAKYGDSVQAEQSRAKEFADIQQLVAGRYPWSRLLSQVGALMPHQAALSSMQATSTPGASASAPPTPAIQLTGCASSQSMVADTMVALHRITGVTAVTLASATDSSAGATGSTGSTAGAGSAGCGFPVQFQVSLTFAPSPAATTAAPSTGATGGSTPTASASTSSTGAATASAAAPSTTPSAQ